MSNLRKQILAKSLPPIGPASSRKKSSPSNRDYSPIDWSEFFDNKQFIIIEKNSFCLYTRNANNNDAPILFFLHGGGFSGLSWAVLSKTVTSLVQCQCVALDIRGHGQTKTTDDNDLNIETLTKDVSQVLHQLYGDEENKPPVFLIGHSMGGALAVHVAKECPSLINALCVIDVVEGSALESLNSMQCFLSSRPKQFATQQQAIEYMVRSGQVRNLESARVSVIGQIQPVAADESNETNVSTTPIVSHLCETVREEEEEEESDETQDHTPTSPTDIEPKPSNNATKYTWRINLSQTEQFWKGWFSGLSKLFLSCDCPKLLVLAGVDRLDRDLTVGQMQGKFQMHVIPQSGHAVHEDAPDQVAQCIASFLVRNKLVEALDEDFEITLPGC